MSFKFVKRNMKSKVVEALVMGLICFVGAAIVNHFDLSVYSLLVVGIAAGAITIDIDQITNKPQSGVKCHFVGFCVVYKSIKVR